MADTFSNNPESSHETIKHPESSPKENKTPESKEIKEASKEFIEGVGEIVETAEGGEVTDGNVGENMGEDKKSGPQGSMKGGAGGQAVVKKIVKEPSIEIMQIQISTQIKHEIRVLEKEMKALQSGRHFNPMKLNLTVSKIRGLRDILANLAHVAAETVKTWWNEFVKGVTN